MFEKSDSFLVIFFFILCPQKHQITLLYRGIWEISNKLSEGRTHIFQYRRYTFRGHSRRSLRYGNKPAKVGNWYTLHVLLQFAGTRTHNSIVYYVVPTLWVHNNNSVFIRLTCITNVLVFSIIANNPTSNQNKIKTAKMNFFFFLQNVLITLGGNTRCFCVRGREPPSLRSVAVKKTTDKLTDKKTVQYRES